MKYPIKTMLEIAFALNFFLGMASCFRVMSKGIDGFKKSLLPPILFLCSLLIIGLLLRHAL